jgi:nitric oxide reductase NorD protein
VEPLMTRARDGQALALERCCALVASALSDGRRGGVRLLSGERRCFGMNAARTIVNVPYPGLGPDWTLRALTGGIALQCSPSKDRIAHYRLQELTVREVKALTIVEAEVALGWVSTSWPGLLPELRRFLPSLGVRNGELGGPAILDRALTLARSGRELFCHSLLGELPVGSATERGLLASVLKVYGRMPWSERKRVLSPGFDTIPVGGDGGAGNPITPPPSQPEEEDLEPRADRRVGIPYPEWNLWTESFLRDHVAVLERKLSSRSAQVRPSSASLRRWFEQRTHRVLKSRLEDGSELDVDHYIEHHIETLLGRASEARVFRDLAPGSRDVTTALLVDGSSSLGINQGATFQLELACADALCRAMAVARERHGLFVFAGNTRHRVEVTCLRDFEDCYSVVPSALGLTTGGYTRLGAPLRHLTRRLLDQPSERRLLIVIGDGLISDDGYEGRYAWADTAHAAEEAGEAGVTVHYVGVGRAHVDPLPDVFGSQRSTRIKRVEELPRALARVHRELVAA